MWTGLSACHASDGLAFDRTQIGYRLAGQATASDDDISLYGVMEKRRTADKS